jgi:RIP metalloprotease RseP
LSLHFFQEFVMLLTVAAFVLALGLLITVHEYGHYRVAVACGVKVLRFSVGFGKPLVRWQSKDSPTEFVLCALPLGAMCACWMSAKHLLPPLSATWLSIPNR